LKQNENFVGNYFPVQDNQLEKDGTSISVEELSNKEIKMRNSGRNNTMQYLNYFAPWYHSFLLYDYASFDDMFHCSLQE
jgi:hypothetical protein